MSPRIELRAGNEAKADVGIGGEKVHTCREHFLRNTLKCSCAPFCRGRSPGVVSMTT